MEKITLTGVFINSKDANGNQLKTKNGEPYENAVIQWGEERATLFLGKFGKKDKEIIQSWKAGDTVEVIIEEKEYNGKTFKNFSIPSKLDKLEMRIEKIEKYLNEQYKGLKPASANDFIMDDQKSDEPW